jgi:hypothetical protein
MTKQLRTQIEIEATPERVWGVLTDFAAFGEWNPFMTRVDGDVRRGERLTIRMQPDGGRAMTFRPTVLEAEPNEHLRWVGRVLVRGVFDGEHSFTIERLGAGRVRLIQQEEFRGILVPFMARSLDRNTLPAFERMNQALKRRAEERQAPEDSGAARRD